MSDLHQPKGTVSDLRTSIISLARRMRASARMDSEGWTALMTLGVIERAKDPATPTEVAAELGLRSSNLAQILGELDERQLILRTPDPSDKRKVRLSLTEVGLALVRETRAKRDLWLSNAMDEALTPQEQAQLVAAGELMRRLANKGTESSSDDTALKAQDR